MKKILALTIVACMASMASAASTLHVWLEYELADPAFVENEVIGLPGDYSDVFAVKIYAEVFGLAAGQGISDMAVTLYTPDVNNALVPLTLEYEEGDVPPVAMLFGPLPPTSLMTINAAAQDLVSPLDPDSDWDSLEMSFGYNTRGTTNRNVGIGAPVLIGTQYWKAVAPLEEPVWMMAYVAPTSKHWTGSASSRALFDEVLVDGVMIPEPITMTMVGMGLSSLGLAVWRRRRAA